MIPLHLAVLIVAADHGAVRHIVAVAVLWLVAANWRTVEHGRRRRGLLATNPLLPAILIFATSLLLVLVAIVVALFHRVQHVLHADARHGQLFLKPRQIRVQTADVSIGGVVCCYGQRNLLLALTYRPRECFVQFTQNLLLRRHVQFFRQILAGLQLNIVRHSLRLCVHLFNL